MATKKKDDVGFWHKLFGTTPNDGDIQPREGIFFSITGFGQNLICTIVGAYLTVFMTDAIGFDALPVAFLMLFARIYDALNDPIMGSIVDRTRTKWGKCRPYLKWMAIPIAVVTILCFLPVYPDNAGGFAAISVVYVIWGMVYTVADVPYWSLTTAMTNNTYKRGNLLTVARIICTLGAGLVTIIVPQITGAVGKSVLARYGGNEDVAAPYIAEQLKWVFFIAAIVCCVIAVPLFFLGFKNTKERVINTTKAPSLGHNLKLLFKNKPLLFIVISGVLGAAKLGFTYTGGFYFAKYVFSNVKILGMQGESLYTLMTMTIVPGGLIASLLVPWFTKKVGKRNTYIWSHIIGGICMLAAFAVGWINKKSEYTDTATVACMFAAFIIAGVPSGFGNIISYAMIGDTVEYLEMKTGERAEGICFAMQTFISKIGMAVGAFLGVLAYDMAGITPNNPGRLNAAGKDTMWIMLMLIGGISMVASALPLFFYHFNEKQQQEAVAIINERKANSAAESGQGDK
jgi:GPH family glycoside/pentoside/hexuronide:cation symporter/probable glucitol transport protein GutA